jgi:hypothetical protein
MLRRNRIDRILWALLTILAVLLFVVTLPISAPVFVLVWAIGAERSTRQERNWPAA